MDFLMRKRILSAEQALELGLVHEVVEPAELRKTPMALAEELAEGPQIAMRLLKRSIYNAPNKLLNKLTKILPQKSESLIFISILEKAFSFY